MSRLIKEVEVHQAFYEALNFGLRDDEDILAGLQAMNSADNEDTCRMGEADDLAAAAEERARLRVANAQHEMDMAKDELKLAHEQRIITKRLHQAFKKREQLEVKLVKDLRLHTKRNRKAVLDWAISMGFGKDILPEAQLMAEGGVRRLLAESRERHESERMSLAEAEAI